MCHNVITVWQCIRKMRDLICFYYYFLNFQSRYWEWEGSFAALTAPIMGTEILLRKGDFLLFYCSLFYPFVLFLPLNIQLWQVKPQNGSSCSGQHQLSRWGRENLPVLERYWCFSYISQTVKGETKVSAYRPVRNVTDIYYNDKMREFFISDIN